MSVEYVGHRACNGALSLMNLQIITVGLCARSNYDCRTLLSGNSWLIAERSGQTATPSSAAPARDMTSTFQRRFAVVCHNIYLQ